jgi:hypothetical protein
MSEIHKSSQENSEVNYITVEEARADMEAFVARFEGDPSESGRFMYEKAKGTLESEESLQVFVDTWNSIVDQQRQMDADS